MHVSSDYSDAPYLISIWIIDFGIFFHTANANMGKSLPSQADSQLPKKSRKKSTKVALVVSEEVGETSKEAITTDSPTKPAGPDGIDTETMFENKKARKRAIRAARHRKPSEDDASSPLEGLKNGKKRKDRPDDGNGNDTESKNSVVDAEEPPRKKHKNRTEFADPRYDESLNPQSRKGTDLALNANNNFIDVFCVQS